jgi:pyridoxine kinase
MSYKRILTIQDISCIGQCSTTVALPILSACGLETIILPTAVLSSHTGGFKGYTFHDLSDDIPKITEQWKNEGISFDAIYTGYLGKKVEIEYVMDILSSFGANGALKIADPAMADGGRLYAGFDKEYADAMVQLLKKADIILPNITEACLLTGTEFRDKYDKVYIEKLVGKLTDDFNATVILKGVSFDNDTTGIMVCTGNERQYYRHKRLGTNRHGTGDVFASSFTGALLKGKSVFDSVKIAGDFTLSCMQKTEGDPSHWYGTKFELALPQLVSELNDGK